MNEKTVLGCQLKTAFRSEERSDLTDLQNCADDFLACFEKPSADIDNAFVTMDMIKLAFELLYFINFDEEQSKVTDQLLSDHLASIAVRDGFCLSLTSLKKDYASAFYSVVGH